jgi:hypothetical protein
MWYNKNMFGGWPKKAKQEAYLYEKKIAASNGAFAGDVDVAHRIDSHVLRE